MSRERTRSVSAPGVKLYNYIDKPDIDMNELVAVVRTTLGKAGARPWRIPYGLGVGLGRTCDVVTKLTGVHFPISAVRVRKYGAADAYRPASQARSARPAACAREH